MITIEKSSYNVFLWHKVPSKGSHLEENKKIKNKKTKKKRKDT